MSLKRRVGYVDEQVSVTRARLNEMEIGDDQQIQVELGHVDDLE